MLKFWFVWLGGQASSEPGRVTCDDCGDTFETQKSYTDHKNDGFC